MSPHRGGRVLVRKSINDREWFWVCQWNMYFGYSDSWEGAVAGALHHIKMRHEKVES